MIALRKTMVLKNFLCFLNYSRDYVENSGDVYFREEKSEVGKLPLDICNWVIYF